MSDIANIKYDLYAAFDLGIKMHPQEAMKSLGITYTDAVPQSIKDSWDFWNCENLPDTLPNYLQIIEQPAHEYIGHGLTKEDALRIDKYHSERKSAPQEASDGR